MTLFWILGLAVLAGVQTSSLADRIVGGAPTTIEDYPSMVQVDFQSIITFTWGQSCAANILTSRFLLSAAHCFAGLFYHPSLRRIRAGSGYRNTGGVLIPIEVALNHPDYGTRGYDGDISVVKLQNSLIYSPAIQQATIVLQGTAIPDNLPVVHAGWGRIYEEGPLSPVLLDVTIYTVNNALCAERYAELYDEELWPVTENMICAGILDVGGKDACQGDSGGPLYYDDVVIGIVSWGEGCANDTYPGISTNVASYTNWVITTVTDNN